LHDALPLERLTGVRCRDHPVAELLEDIGRQHAYDVVILDNQDGFLGRYSRTPVRRKWGGIGRPRWESDPAHGISFPDCPGLREKLRTKRFPRSRSAWPSASVASSARAARWPYAAP